MRFVAEDMNSNHLPLGILLLAATLSFLAVTYCRVPKVAAMPFWGWGGLAIILSSEALLILHVDWVTTFFTPIVWTGYLLLVDALVWSLQGSSRLGRTPRHFLALAFWSVPLWLIFEACNLRLRNWIYLGVPSNPVVNILGYAWAFATIWPGIFETSDFILALRLFCRAGRTGSDLQTLNHKARPWSGRFKQSTGPFAVNRRVISSSPRRGIAVLGFLMVVLPVVLPPHFGAYLFGLVWIGFVPMLEPLNYAVNGRSLLRDFESGNYSTLFALLVAGWVCGILWEFWNYWASAKWLYIFPIFQSWKIFEMPALGYLGFPPFAVECFVMYEFLRTIRKTIKARESGSESGTVTALNGGSSKESRS